MNLLLRRRKFIVNRKLQFSLLMISFSYAIFFLIVTGLALFVPLISKLDKADQASKQVFQIANQMIYLHDNFWPAALMCLIVIGLHSIRTSHRIAGPLYRVNMAFQSIKDCVIPKPLHQLRKGDYLQEEYEIINEMIGALRTKITDIQEAKTDYENASDKCMDTINEASRDELVKCLDEITEKGNLLKKKIEAIKIES